MNSTKQGKNLDLSSCFKSNMYKDFINSKISNATKMANEFFGKVSASTKSDDNNQVLTEADLAIGNYLVKSIKSQYPSHNIIDEESGIVDNDSDFTWVVDPVDGTSNFANGLPMYGIIIGLLEKNNPIAGGVALPYFNEIYIAEMNKGCTLNGVSIKNTYDTPLIDSLVAYGIDGHQENPSLTSDECESLEKLILKIRNLRSSNSCFDAMMVVKGKYGAYLNKTSKIWDNVGLEVVLNEAGYNYTDCAGRSIDYDHPLTKVKENFEFLMCAPNLHSDLLHIFQN